MRAALVMVDWNTGESFCHILHGEDPLGDAHLMYAQIRREYPDCEFAFLADDSAKRRYGERVFQRGAGLPVKPSRHTHAAPAAEPTTALSEAAHDV